LSLLDNPAVLDFQRPQRIGQSEAVYCQSKTPAQIEAIVQRFVHASQTALLTRLSPTQHTALATPIREQLAYDELSQTAFLGTLPLPASPPSVAIVSAGTSDAAVCAEAARTLLFNGQACVRFEDIGVAGLWRLLERIETLRSYPVLIVVAGMEGAIFSVLGGLVGNVIIAVPTATGYGVTAGGHAALQAALGSCAPGIMAVNINNGYGAACAALRILHSRSC